MCMCCVIASVIFPAHAAAATVRLISLSDQDRGGKCQGRGQECVFIMSCGDLLGILFLSEVAEFAATFLLFQATLETRNLKSSW